MKKTLITALAILILPAAFSHATEVPIVPTEDVEVVAEITPAIEEPLSIEDFNKLNDKEKLMSELRTFRATHDVPAATTTKPPMQSDIGAGVVPPLNVEHPSFGLKDLYPDVPAPVLDPYTKQAIVKAKKWLHQTNTPIVQKGKLIQPYGNGVPTLILAPMSISSIELSPDETIVPSGVQLADLQNFGVEETYGGSRRGKFPVLIVKSKTLDEMKTVLIVITTKRIYHVQLVSSEGEWTPKLSFSYPEEGVIRSPQTISRLLNEQGKEAAANVAVVAQDGYLYSARDTDFGYSTKGDSKIMPLRVFGLGHQTVIEMDSNINKINAPAILLEDSEGNEEMVNARFDNKTHRYILDQPIYTAYLISGVGWDQSKVTIKKLEDK